MGRLHEWSNLYRDFETHPIERMLKCSTVALMHQDVFRIDETLQEIAQLFAQAVLNQAPSITLHVELSQERSFDS